MLPRENRRRMLTASSPYSTPAYTRGGGSLVPSSLGTRFMGAGALTASSSSTTGGTPPSLHFISARLEDDLKTMWQFRLTGDSWADQLPSTKALQTVRQCINAISPGSTRNVWDTLVIGRTTVANVMVAAEMVVQIAEAVGMGTHYWTPERLDASRLMASTEGMVDLNIARLGQVQAEAWGTTAMAGDLSRDFVKRHGQPVYDLVGCWPSWDVLDQGHPRWTEVQKFAQFHSQVWARVSPTVHAMGNFIFRPKSGVGAKVLSIDDVFTPIFDAMDGFWDKAVSGTKPTWATAGSSENLVTLERLLVVDAIVYMAKAFYHFAVAWDGQAERRKLAVSSWNRKMEKNDEERRRTIERHQKDVDRLLGDQKAFALDNQKVAIPRHISELRMWLTEVRRVCRSANIYTPEDVAIVADRFFRCQSSVDNEWLMQSEVWAAFWGKLQSTRFDAMCVDSIGLMLAEKMGYHVFASKSQEVSQLQAEVKWMVNKKPVLHYMFQRIMDMVIMLTPAEAFKLTAVALFDLNNQVFIKMAKEIQTDTEVWEYLLKGTGQSTPEASPEIWNVDEDVLGKVMRRVQKTIIDEWKWSGPRSGTPTQGNQNQGGGDGAGPFEPGDEVYWGQGYSRRGPQFYGQRPQGGPGQGRQRFQRSYYNPRVHRPLCMKKAGALWLKSGAMCKSNCQNFHPEGWDDSVQKEVLRKVRYDYPVGPFHGLLNTNKYSQELKNLQDRDRKAYDQKGWTDPGEAPYLKGEWEKFRVWNPLTSDGGDAPASMGRDIPGRHGNESVDPSWNLRGSSDASSARSAASSSSSSSSSSSDRSDRGHLDNRRSRSRSRDRRSDREVTHVSGGRHYDERDEARDRRGYDRGGHVRGGYDRGRRDSRNRDRSPERSRDRSPPRRRGGRSDSRERPNSNRSPQWGGNQGSSLFPNANVYGGGAGTFPSSHMQQAGAGAYYAGPAPGQQLPVGYGQPMQQQFYQGQPQQQVVAYGGQSYIPPAPILPAPGMPMGGGQGTVGGQMPPQQQVQGQSINASAGPGIPGGNPSA